MAFQSGTAWGLESDRADSWQKRASCRVVDPELMWADSGNDLETAVAVCHRCPVALKCLEDGVDDGDWESVRGGLSGKERWRFHRAGRAPEDYGPHVPEPKQCALCGKRFRHDPEHPTRRNCPTCRPAADRAQRRAYSRLPHVVAAWRDMSAQGLSLAAAAYRLGYSSHHGLRRALIRARRSGLLNDGGES
jgi:WhiB family redox-sensing transcriptional regulator